MEVEADDVEDFLNFCTRRAQELGVPVPDFHLSLIPAAKKSKAEIKKMWMKVRTDGGVPYFWNVHTGQTLWTFEKFAAEDVPSESDITDAGEDQHAALRRMGGGQGFWSFTTMKPGKNRDG
jgi:hypothetical protein